MAQIKYNLGDLGTDKYSTEEIKIGTWIDGKPLYRKVVNFTIPALSSSSAYLTNIVDLSAYNIDELTRINSIATISGHKVPFSHFDGANSGICYDTNTKNIKFCNLVPSWVGCQAFAIIEYTKTTDA